MESTMIKSSFLRSVRPLLRSAASLGLFWLLLSGYFSAAQTVAPFAGLGSAQFFDNNGKPLTAGVLYSYQAGTTNQQATFTDATGTTQNPNPIPFGSGARVNIWLTAGNFYKFVLCLQNDGAFCAPADILFTVDNVPGSPASINTGSTYIGTFISGSPNPASSGILRLASSDQICWRNAAGTTNLCILKDANDVLEWAGGTMKFPEVTCSNNGLNFDYLCADSSTHHWKFSGNGSAQLVIPGVSTAGIASHMVNFAANGYDLQDSGELMTLSTAVTFSATPTFAAQAQNQLFTLTLTGNVTASTMTTTGLVAPAYLTFEITQDATGGRTFVWPANVLGALAPNTAPNSTTSETFIWDGTNANYIAPPCTSQSKNSAYTIQAGDCMIQADATSASFTIKLPHLVTGQQWTISRTDTSTHTLTISMDLGNVNGVSAFTVARNSTAICHADGANGWCNVAGPVPQLIQATVLTASAGTATYTFPVPYSVAPICQCTPVAVGGSGSCNLQSSTATACVFNVGNSAVLIDVIAIGVP
jgi:hypothetical protein